MSCNAQLFRKNDTLRFRQTDAAGIAFFASYFEAAHDTLEEFISFLGFEWKQWFENQNLAFPLCHAEADYFQPLRAGEPIEIQASIRRLGESSVTFEYTFNKLKPSGVVAAKVTLKHVCFDKKKQKASPWPPEWRTKLDLAQN